MSWVYNFGSSATNPDSFDNLKTGKRKSPSAMASHANQLEAELSTLRAELEASRDTNKRLNRRVQEAEAAVPDYKKLIAVPPDGDGVRFVQGSLGRALLALHASKLSAELDRVRGALQEIADCKIFNSHDPADCTDDVFEWGSAIVRTAREALDTKEVGE